MSYFIAVLKKYAVFNGRARRKEYWMFFLFYVLISFVLGLVLGLSGMPQKTASAVINLYSLALFLPSIAVTIRRMHDTNRSGWYCIIPVYGFILLFFNGDKGANRFGADPKEAQPAVQPVA